MAKRQASKKQTATKSSRAKRPAATLQGPELRPDDGWAEALTSFLAGAPPEVRVQWQEFLTHCSQVLPAPPVKEWRFRIEDLGTGGSLLNLKLEEIEEGMASGQLSIQPSSNWIQQAKTRIDGLGTGFGAQLLSWIRLVPVSRPGMLSRQSPNRELMRGLIWSCLAVEPPDIAPALRIACESFYSRNSQLGDAVIGVLARLPGRAGASELSVLCGRLKYGAHRRLAERGLKLIAERLGVETEELREGSVPTLGFGHEGVRETAFGSATARILITGNRTAELQWLKDDGTPFKSLPARLQRDFAAGVAEQKVCLRSVRDALAVVCRRLETLCIDERAFSVSEWRQNYLNHPVSGVPAGRLIWDVLEGKKQQSVTVVDGELVNRSGKTVRVADSATIRLWHPVGAMVDEVLSWRTRLEALNVTQPFRQAHREIYLLTDAERTTRTYSNRFAAHILRQSQFRAVAKARGWTTSFLGAWDGGDQGTAVRILPRYGLRAEFSFQPYGEEHATGYVYLRTDRVQFVSIGEKSPVCLADIPPLAFSEILRDIDLFIGVGSIGNDPAWLDNGPERTGRDYWQSYAFGELGTSAVVRRDVLSRLIPRLSIATRCRLTDRFLIVRGDLRTYHIHLGSANILMEPNSQYLCIVPKQAGGSADFVALPFEGDTTLSLILSKALLLADDTRIADPSIARQIQGTVG